MLKQVLSIRFHASHYTLSIEGGEDDIYVLISQHI